MNNYVVFNADGTVETSFDTYKDLRDYWRSTEGAGEGRWMYDRVDRQLIDPKDL